MPDWFLLAVPMTLGPVGHRYLTRYEWCAKNEAFGCKKINEEIDVQVENLNRLGWWKILIQTAKVA